MQKLTVQLMDEQRNVQREKEIQVTENEILIMKYPETMTMDQAYACFKLLSNVIEEGNGVIGLPESINFEILKIN